MDPKQTLIELLEAIAARDFEEAQEKLDAFAEWIERGGFMPESIHAALDAIRFE